MSGRRRGNQSPADADYDVPFFTVAHYKSPTATPTTYEFAAPHVSMPNYNKNIPRDIPTTPANNYVPGTSPVGGYMHSSSPKGYPSYLPGSSPKSATSYLPGTSPMGHPSYLPSTSPKGVPSYAPGTSPKGIHSYLPGSSPKEVPPSNVAPLNLPSIGHKITNNYLPDSRIDSSIQGFCGEGAGESLCNDGLETNISPVSLAFGPSLPGESWWPPDDIISPSEVSPSIQYKPIQQNAKSYEDIRRSRTRERTPVDTIPEAPFHEQSFDSSSMSSDFDDIQIKQSVNFTISPPTRPKSRKRTPEPPPSQKRPKPTTPNGGSNSNLSRAIKVYEDASVSDAGEQLFPSPSSEGLLSETSQGIRSDSANTVTASVVAQIFVGNTTSSSCDTNKKPCNGNQTQSEISFSGSPKSTDEVNQYIKNDTVLSKKFDTTDAPAVQTSVNEKHTVVNPPDSVLKDVPLRKKESITSQPQNCKPQIPPKPTQQQIESASRRNSQVDPCLDHNRLSLCDIQIPCNNLSQSSVSNSSQIPEQIKSAQKLTNKPEPQENNLDLSIDNSQSLSPSQKSSLSISPQSPSTTLSQKPNQSPQSQCNKDTPHKPAPKPEEQPPATLPSSIAKLREGNSGENTTRPKVPVSTDSTVGEVPRPSTAKTAPVAQPDNTSSKKPSDNSGPFNRQPTADVTPRTPRTPRSKSRFNLFLVDSFYFWLLLFGLIYLSESFIYFYI